MFTVAASRICAFRNPSSSGAGTAWPCPSSKMLVEVSIAPPRPEKSARRRSCFPTNDTDGCALVPVKPAISGSSVGGMCACATSRCEIPGAFGGKAVSPSGSGNTKPPELSKGSPDAAEKRPSHISRGAKAMFTSIGERRWLRAPVRPGPTTSLLSTPIAMDWLSPKPFDGA